MADAGRAKVVVAKLRSRLRVDPHSWRGAAWALRVSGIAIVVALATTLLLVGTGLERALGIAVMVGIVLLGAAATIVIADLIRRLPAPFTRAAAMLGAALCVPLVFLVSGRVVLAIVVALIVLVAVLGGSIASLRSTGWRFVNTLGAFTGATALIGVLGLYLVPGWPVEQPERPVPVAVPVLEVGDPAVPGAYTVASLAYGSGSDRHRAEYAADADLVTTPVDGAKLIDGWDGFAGWARTRYWGFDATALPLQGRVWAPARGEDADSSTQARPPYPLVLIVHGNHDMEDYSDGGYAYLGNLFASRGFITVSVDENFLNSSYSDLVGGPDGGLEAENDARGWLLLKHLALFRAWNAEPGHRFNGQVDLDRVVLIGHSRGGEAVAEAALFNRLPRYPDDARLAFDHGFGIRGVIAIAPADGQYDPRDRATRLSGLSYLVIHGSLDGDVQSFSGSAQYSRIDLAGCVACFKSSVYVVGANHGQFNTSWGRNDVGAPFGQLLNVAPILEPQTQRHVAQVLFSAFLEAVLHDDQRYRALFVNPERGRQWLGTPEIVARFDGGADRLLATFEEDDDVTTGTAPGVRLDGTTLTTWRENEIELKADDLDSAAVVLGWQDREADNPARYDALFDTPIALAADSLSFVLAMSEEAPLDDAEQGDDEAWTPPEWIDFHVELVDAGNGVARMALADVAPLAQPVRSTTRKATWLDSLDQSEPVFRRYTFGVEEWQKRNPAIDVAHIVAVRFVFDVTPAGVVMLDDLGIGSR